MNLELLFGLFAFALVTSITPGPNNIMLMASGANFGLRRSVPHLLGVSLGHAAQAALVGLGIAGLFKAYPASNAVLTAASVLYMLWLAWKIAHARAPEGQSGSGRPLTFLQAAAFQWVNPKAWSMSLTVMTVYLPGEGIRAVLAVAGVFAMVNLPSVSTWVLAGQGMRRLLSTPGRLRAFNRTMAGLLVASLWPVLGPMLAAG